MSVQPGRTYADVMAEQLEKIANALKDLTAVPLPRELILLYVQKKTRLARRDIEAVFDAIQELNKKVPKSN